MAEEQECHLFVLVHGLWGSPRNLLTIEKVLKEILVKNLDKKIVILRPSGFSFWKTYDGLKICAERVLYEMFYEIETLKKNNYKVTELSIVGYSLGGLISRYLIGILQDIEFFKYVKPIFFTTFATPHVGIEFFKNNYFDKTANSLGGYLFGKSGRQLFLTDNEKILTQLANPELRYFKGLQNFQKLILLANIKNDRTVSFFTSFITEYSPFENFEIVKIKYLKDLPTLKISDIYVRGKVVDLNRSNFEINGKLNENLNKQEETSFFRSSKLIRGAIIVLAAFILPIWIPTILTATLISSIYSMIKIRILNYKEPFDHWEKVKSGVYGNSQVDDEDYKIGTKKRQQRKDLNKHESFRGDTSKIAETVMERMLYADERFIHGDGHNVGNDELGDSDIKLIDPIDTISTAVDDNNKFDKLDNVDEQIVTVNQKYDDDSETSEDEVRNLLNPVDLIFKSKKKLLEIDIEAHEKIMLSHLDSLSNIDYENYPLFIKESKLPIKKDKELIISSLNTLPWIKLPIFLDAWNAHDGIVARRGPKTNPKGTASIALWASVLKDHLDKNNL